jgi:hypothetical protein
MTEAATRNNAVAAADLAQDQANLPHLAEILLYNSFPWIESSRKTREPLQPRIVAFADLVGSTADARVAALTAFARTLVHHLVTYAIPEYLLRNRQVRIIVIKTMGDDRRFDEDQH